MRPRLSSQVLVPLRAISEVIFIQPPIVEHDRPGEQVEQAAQRTQAFQQKYSMVENSAWNVEGVILAIRDKNTHVESRSMRVNYQIHELVKLLVCALLEHGDEIPRASWFSEHMRSWIF